MNRLLPCGISSLVTPGSRFRHATYSPHYARADSSKVAKRARASSISFKMAALGSPGMSDVDQPSSPPVPRSHSHGGHGNNGLAHEQSFATNLTEDEDTRMMGGTPDPSEGPSRRRKRDTSAQNKENVGKVKHLKKDDGEPLWRKDIQYDFLKAVFDNDLKVFTNSYERDLPPQCFADLYIDTMSRSSKTSKVLRDKLLSDREAAKGMAMVCLLVNIGRMNTTLNCESLQERPAQTMIKDGILIVACPFSFPRDASSAPNLPCHTFPTSLPRSPSIQAIARCSTTEVDTQRRNR